MLEELGVESAENKIQNYKFNWPNRVSGMKTPDFQNLSSKPRRHRRPLQIIDTSTNWPNS